MTARGNEGDVDGGGTEELSYHRIGQNGGSVTHRNSSFVMPWLDHGIHAVT
ncbi:hypothetical protein [Pannonibacter sp.]|uniref:hypothetical protein n=1 Tax=Pannonibacter sp. TaxID=1906786 RepID=UPI003F72520B